MQQLFFIFFTALCLVAGSHATVLRLTPRSLSVCPDGAGTLQRITFTCTTDTGVILWTLGNQSSLFTSNISMVNDTGLLGDFTTRLDSVEGLNYTSTAIVNVSSLQSEDSTITIMCDDNEDAMGPESAVLIVKGLPSAPSVTSITQSSSSSQLISWSMSDCAVQYVVTIIDSSDGSVYLNITTSDTNTTVTLPTGVQYCVTVLGVDSINRTGQPSESQCHIHVVPAATSASRTSSQYQQPSSIPPRPVSSTVAASTSSSPLTSPTAGSPDVGGVSAIAVAVLLLLLILLVVIVSVVVIVILLVVRKKGRSRTENFEIAEYKESPKLQNSLKLVASSSVSPDCKCQVFYHKTSSNCWRIVFAFFPKDQLVRVKQVYQDVECGPSVDELVFQCDKVEITCPTKLKGWSSTQQVMSVTTAAVELYTGEGEPPYCEMTLRATDNMEECGDLHLQATINGVTTIKIDRPYERTPSTTTDPSSLSSADSATPQSTADIPLSTEQDTAVSNGSANLFQCVCQVFYFKQETNYWRLKLAFCKQEHLDKMKEFYQQSSTITDGVCVDVYFQDGATSIKVSTDTADANGWNMNVEEHNCQVTAAAVEQYTGEGEPPYCEMTLRPAEDNMTLNADFTVTFIGAQPPNNIIKIQRILEGDAHSNLSDPREYVCQVFYKQNGINCWIVVFSFFPKDFHEEVEKLYYTQYIEVGPSFDLQLMSEHINVSAGEIEGWSCEFNHQYQVSMKEVEQYTGVGKPPRFDLILRAAMPDGSTPPDLTLPVTLTGVKQPTTITLEREAQQCSAQKESSSSSEQEIDTNDTTKYTCQVFYYKEKTNYWTVTVAFLSVKQGEQSFMSFFQNATIGPVADFQFKKRSDATVKVGVDKTTIAQLGWAVTIDPQHSMVTKTAIDEYVSSDETAVKPPCCVMTFQPRFKGSLPSDLSVSLTLVGGQLLQPITLERESEAPSPELSSNSSQESAS